MVARYRCWLCQGRWKPGGRAAWEEHYRVMHLQTARTAPGAPQGGGKAFTLGNRLRPSTAPPFAQKGASK